MTLPQIISLISVSVLTIVAVIVGIELIIVLKELKSSLTRVNRTLDTADETLQKLSQPAVGLFAIIEGFRQSGKIVEMVTHLLGRDKPTPPVDLDDHEPYQ
jgi:energy-coupling factor transporter transmembrane protein EcfT